MKIIRHLVPLCLSMALLVTLPGRLQAQFAVQTNGDGTCTITNYTGAGGAVTIPSAIAYLAGFTTNSTPIYENETVVGFGAVFANNTTLTSVSIPDSVASIAPDAFSGCASLTTVSLPESVTGIGPGAFVDCSNLLSITIPDGVISIPSAAFDACKSLTNVLIPAGVTSIGDGAFIECTSLPGITIPEGVTNFGESAFQDCASLARLNIPDSVVSLGAYAIAGCSNLTSLTIPDSVTTMGNFALYGCGLTNLIVPNNITNLGGWLFGGCANLTHVVIRDGISGISYSEFVDCTSLTSITIPASVTNLAASAFNGCTSLAYACFEGEPPTVGTSIFEGDPLPVIDRLGTATGWGSTYAGIPTVVCAECGVITGSLQVTITPAGAVNAGAQWSIDGTNWLNGGVTISNILAGTYTVEFSQISGWKTPASQLITVSNGIPATVTGSYTPTGSLQVIITPAGVVNAGAQWTVDGTNWVDSGASLSNILTGAYNVQFSQVASWKTPANQTVAVAAGTLTTATGIYLPTGSLQVTITPAGAVNAGAQWSVDGTNWLSGGVTLANLPTGSYAVQFSQIFGWLTPTTFSLSVTNGSLTSAAGNYIAQHGAVQVTIEPKAAVTADAHWRLDGGAWQKSGLTVTNLSVGNHTVSYQPITGHATPINETFECLPNTTQSLVGTYTISGSLQVTLTPAAAVTAGAEWQVDGGTFQHSGTSVGELSAGTHSLAFRTLYGWSTPANRTVTITAKVKTIEKAVYMAVTNQLHIHLAGLGTISPNDTNAWLQIGKNYVITAKPAKGYVFSNWIVSTNGQGGWSTNKPTLHFMMASNLTLTATFVAATKPAVLAHPQVIASPSVSMTDLRLTAGSLLFKLQITGSASGLIQSSTNLANWSTVTNFTGTNTTINFCDPGAANSSRQFYRVVQ